MNKKGEMSALKAWLLVAASLIDDAAVLALVFLGLWLAHVKITWPLIAIAAAAVAVYAWIMHKAVIPAIRRRKVTGREGMVGMMGVVTETLRPAGTVKIKGEYWEAVSGEGNIEAGEAVEVVKIEGLHLQVRRKK